MPLHHIIYFDPVLYEERKYLKGPYPLYLRKRLGIAHAYPGSSIKTGSKLHKALHESAKAPRNGGIWHYALKSSSSSRSKTRSMRVRKSHGSKISSSFSDGTVQR